MKASKTDKWLSFDELTSTDQNSPNYHEGSRVGIFYAESWALAHMLYLSPEYKDNFGKFVMALHRGSSAAEAVRIAFNRTPEEVYKRSAGLSRPEEDLRPGLQGGVGRP